MFTDLNNKSFNQNDKLVWY